MKVKIVLFGENVAIPKTPLHLGIGLVSVWIDDSGFTSATNDLGAALGYVLLETKNVDLGAVDDVRQQAFSNLHGKIVKFRVDPNTFVKDGGIAKIRMAVQDNAGGAGGEPAIEFVADNCTGISVKAGAMEFMVEMLQKEALAGLGDGQVVSDDDVVAISDEAPGEDAPVA